MVPMIGLLVGIYAIARLLQVPIEASPWSKRWILLLVISVPAAAVIAFLMIGLITTSANVPDVPAAFRQ